MVAVRIPAIAHRELADIAAQIQHVKPDRMFGSGGGTLGFFDLDVASDRIEHGHLSLLDRCDGIVHGERSLFVQKLGMIRSALNGQIDSFNYQRPL